jgi:MFS family permease
MAKLRLPRVVYVVGLVSLFTDLSSEMIVPLLPAFMQSLGGGATWVGLADGIGDAVAALVRLPAGLWADRVTRRKPMVVLGYGLSSLARPLMAACSVPLAAVGVRFTDRIGKGLRSAPRDAIVADAVTGATRGAAFGLDRALDHTGALLGALAAFALLAQGIGPRWVFGLAAIPGLAAMLTLIFGLREGPRAEATSSSSTREAARGIAMSPVLRTTLLAILVFGLASASELFVVMRAQSLGMPLRYAPLLWASLHLPRMLLTGPLGALSDRLSRRQLIVTGWLVHVVAAVGLAFAGSLVAVWGLAVLLGAEAAFTEGAEKALVTDLTPALARGRTFGWYNLCVGLAALPASVGFGLIWDHGSARAAFLTSAALGAVAITVLLASSRRTYIST